VNIRRAKILVLVVITIISRFVVFILLVFLFIISSLIFSPVDWLAILFTFFLFLRVFSFIYKLSEWIVCIKLFFRSVSRKICKGYTQRKRTFSIRGHAFIKYVFVKWQRNKFLYEWKMSGRPLLRSNMVYMSGWSCLLVWLMLPALSCEWWHKY